MKTVKMKISGIAVDNNLFNPVIVLRSSNGKVFPVPIGNYDKASLFGAFIHKKPVHSELVLKLLEAGELSIKKVVLQNNGKGEAVAKVHFNGTKSNTIELSPTAGILLCLETGEEILVSYDLFKDDSFFRNKLDSRKMITDFEKMFLDTVNSTDIPDVFSPWKDTIQ
jgi:bifunctional DNase/RNase